MKSMHSVLTSIGRELIHLLPPTVTSQKPSEAHGHFHLSKEGFGDLFLWPDQVQAFYTCLAKVEEVLKPNWDEKSLFNLTEILVLQAVDPKAITNERKFSKRMAIALEKWVEPLLETPVIWDVYFGVHNLSQKCLPLTIGSVTFLAIGEAEKEIHVKHDEISLISPDSPTVKESMRDMFVKNMRRENVPTSARVRVHACTSAAATKLAMLVLRPTLEVLNFYADIIHIQPTIVYLPGDAANAGQFVNAFKYAEDGTAKSGNYSSQLAGIFSALLLKGEYLERAQSCGFNRACELLSSESLNPVESRVATALRWAGQAAANSALKNGYQEKLDAEREQSFLFYAICLESLFCERRENSIGGVTDRLAKRCAILLARTPAHRKSVIKRVKDVYDIRSDIVHQGNSSISKEELKEIRLFATESIIKMLTEQELLDLKSDEELKEWFLKEYLKKDVS